MADLQRIAIFCVSIALAISSAAGENRTFDGTGNNLTFTSQGASNEPLVRITYPSFYGDPTGETFIYDFTNARDISNTISSQSSSIPSKRGLSDLIWVWGQFLAHDMSLTTTTNGASNGEMPIPITSENDPLGPNPIPFTRSDFRLVDTIPPPTSMESWCEGCREQINENTSYVDASTVYGSTPARAAALRTTDGAGARLLTGQDDLLPYNTMDLPNENVGRFSAEELFAAGDIRSNENPLLAAMHTVFMREHNRLVGIIEQQQPSLSDEETFQLARQIVGAEMQVITYNDYLPALMGEHAPAARDYSYDPTVNASITQSFSHAINRWGHSAISPQLQLVGDNGASLGHLTLRDAYSDPTILSNDADKIDQLLRGAATQVSQEIDVYVVDDVRNFLFGPPGAGGLDLAALNIQRGRDHGLPGYVLLELFYGLEPKTEVSQVTSDPDLATALTEVYNDDIVFADAWVLALAEDHLPETSVGELTMTVMAHQYVRLRDGDRLFYLSDNAGLYEDGTLKSEIESIIDLDNITLADVIRANTNADLPDNAFFAAGLPSGDFDGDWQYRCSDLDALGSAIGGDDMRFDMNGDGQVSEADVMDQEYGWLTVGGAHNTEITTGNPYYAGDANLDGVVDQADLAIWQEHNFTSDATYCSGDFNLDGRVDVSDFNVWNDHQSMRSSAASVPEPSAMVLLVTAMLSVFGVRERLSGSH